MKSVYFERAIFFGWYCKLRDCKFCYMSTINPTKKAVRTPSSILAEALICKKLGWKIEFLSSGYKAYPFDNLLKIINNTYLITKEKQWLNIGPLSESQIKKLKPYIKGYSGAIECANPELRKKLCPSKSIEEIINTFKLCDKYGLEKSITIILGLGEDLNDFEHLKKLIKEYKISRLTFYALNPHKGTGFKKGPEKKYYIKWIKKTRNEFPKIKIIAGSWINRYDEISELLKAGADNITKFPSIEMFNSKYAREIERQVSLANMNLKGSLTKLPNINWGREISKLPFEDNLKNKINSKLRDYLELMQKPKT